MKKITSKFMAMFIAVVVAAGTVPADICNVQAEESTNYTIKVNLGTNCTTIYNKKGKAIKAMICSPSSESPTGTFYVPVKYRWHEMIGNCYAQYCTRITTGVLFHSVWYYKNGDKSTMSVAAYNVMGQKASHGCVRLLCKDAKWIYDHCAVGTKIQIFWGSKKDDPLKRPSFMPIRNGKFTDWDPTDPDVHNPYKKTKPTVEPISPTIEYGAKIKNLSSLVTVSDGMGNEIEKSDVTIKTKGKINTNKLGSYKITYTIKDLVGRKGKKTVKFKVVDTKVPVISGAKNRKNVAMGNTLDVKTGVTAKAVSGKNLTSKIKITAKRAGKKVAVRAGKITFQKKGKYKITYKVKGSNKKTASKTVTYQVTDQRVKFALKASEVKITEGASFDAYNYISSLTTYRGVNLNKKKNVIVMGVVNTKKAGVYTITYKAQQGKKTYTAVTKKLKVAVVKAAAKPQTPTTPEQTTSPEQTTPPQTTSPEGTTTPEQSTPEGTTSPSEDTTANV